MNEFQLTPSQRISSEPKDLPLFNHAYLIWLIRAGHGCTWNELCDKLEILPRQDTVNAQLYRSLIELTDTGLIETNGRSSPFESDFDGDERTFKVTPLLRHMQHALQISISELASCEPENRIIVSPTIETVESDQYGAEIFVLMSFAPELRPLYDVQMKNVAQQLQMTIARGDDFQNAEYVIREIWTAIRKAKMIIADCTGRNSNVFYEIGLAHAIGKPVVLVTSDINDVPFDLRHERIICREHSTPGLKAFEGALIQTIINILKSSKS